MPQTVRLARRSTPRSRRPEETPIAEDLKGSLKKRADSVLEWAEATGLLEGGRGQVIRGRMPAKLVAVAKARTGIKSDTKLLEVALANLAAEDDYGTWLLSRAGRIPKDIDLEF